MKEPFKMFRRKGGMFYARDTATMSKESLGTKDREQASRLVAAKNQAQEQEDRELHFKNAGFRCSEETSVTLPTGELVTVRAGDHLSSRITPDSCTPVIGISLQGKPHEPNSMTLLVGIRRSYQNGLFQRRPN